MIVFSLPLIFLVFLVSILPIVWSFLSSMDPGYFKLIGKIWFDGSFRLSVLVSYILSILSTFLSFLIGTRLGFIMNESKKFRTLIYSSTMFIWILPYYVLIPFIRMFLDFINPDFLYDPVIAFTITVITKTILDIPMIALMAFSISRGIPKSVHDSLIMDGANPSEMFSVYGKQIRMTLSPYMILLIISGMKDVGVPLLLTNGGPTLGIGFSSLGSSGVTTTFGIFLKTSIDRMDNDPIFLAKSGLVSAVLIFTLISLWGMYRKWRFQYILFGMMEILWFGFVGIPQSIFFILYRLFKKRWLLSSAIIFSILVSFHERSISPSLLTLTSYIVILGFGERKVGFPKLLDIFSRYSILVPWILTAVFIFLLFFLSSFTEFPDLGLSGSFKVNLYGFRKLVQDDFHINILNSLMIGTGSAILTTTLILLSIVTSVGKGRYIFRITGSILSTTLILTGMNTLLPLFIIFRNIGILNTYLSVILVTTNRSLPITYFIIMEDMKRINMVMEQAMIDGASGFSLILRIIYPTMIPSILVCFSYSFIKGWMNFIVPLIFLSNPKLFPVSVKLFEYAGDPTLQYTHWNAFALGGFVASSMIALLSLVLKNRISSDVSIEEI